MVSAGFLKWQSGKYKYILIILLLLTTASIFLTVTFDIPKKYEDTQEYAQQKEDYENGYIVLEGMTFYEYIYDMKEAYNPSEYFESRFSDYINEELNSNVVIALFIFLILAFGNVRSSKYQSFMGSMPYTKKQMYITWWIMGVFMTAAAYLTAGVSIYLACGNIIANPFECVMSLMGGFMIVVTLYTFLMVIEAYFNSSWAVFMILPFYMVLDLADYISGILYMYTPYDGMSLKTVVSYRTELFTSNKTYIINQYIQGDYDLLDQRIKNLAAESVYNSNYIICAVVLLVLTLLLLYAGIKVFGKNEYADSGRSFTRPIPLWVRAAAIFLMTLTVVGYAAGFLLYGIVYGGKYGYLEIFGSNSMLGTAVTQWNQVSDFEFVLKNNAVSELPVYAGIMVFVISLAITAIILNVIKKNEIKNLARERRYAQ